MLNEVDRIMVSTNTDTVPWSSKRAEEYENEMSQVLPVGRSIQVSEEKGAPHFAKNY
jgi:hypothetical protein